MVGSSLRHRFQTRGECANGASLTKIRPKGTRRALAVTTQAEPLDVRPMYCAAQRVDRNLSPIGRTSPSRAATDLRKQTGSTRTTQGCQCRREPHLSIRLRSSGRLDGRRRRRRNREAHRQLPCGTEQRGAIRGARGARAGLEPTIRLSAVGRCHARARRILGGAHALSRGADAANSHTAAYASGCEGRSLSQRRFCDSDIHDSRTR